MPIPTPFHASTAPLCESHEWRNWSGYLAAGIYEPSHEREYYAIRNSAGLIDVSPLFKYEIGGPDATRLVDRIMTRNILKCRVGQVMYSPWCDEHGKVIDDGTISRLEEQRYRITAADPNLRWFQDVGYGLNATVRDISTELAALSLQGPLSREVLKGVVDGIDLDKLGYFRVADGTFDGRFISVSRTGYTGDLGYELWVKPEDANQLYEMLMDRGRAYGLLPVGIILMDIARVEAGLLLIEVDYISAHKAIIDAQLSSPFEIGLGWAVWLKGADFIGRRALLRENERGSKWAFAGLEADWDAIERLYRDEDLPPGVAGRASRAAVPIYRAGRQIGQATSHTFSPILKQYIAMGTVLTPFANAGEVQLEMTVEYERKTVPARIIKMPFYDPAWKRA